jgi:hypothetical protein
MSGVLISPIDSPKVTSLRDVAGGPGAAALMGSERRGGAGLRGGAEGPDKFAASRLIG